jgi:hypothetical protein
MDGYNMTHLEIIDDNGVIESGPEDEVLDAWDRLLSGKYDTRGMIPFKGDVKLVEVRGVW